MIRYGSTSRQLIILDVRKYFRADCRNNDPDMEKVSWIRWNGQLNVSIQNGNY